MKIKTALILCAGFGERLKPLTLKKPKPLLELNNMTILESCIDTIIKLGIKKILLNTFICYNLACSTLTQHLLTVTVF